MKKILNKFKQSTIFHHSSLYGQKNINRVCAETKLINPAEGVRLL